MNPITKNPKPSNPNRSRGSPRLYELQGVYRQTQLRPRPAEEQNAYRQQDQEGRNYKNGGKLAMRYISCKYDSGEH